MLDEDGYVVGVVRMKLVGRLERAGGGLQRAGERRQGLPRRERAPRAAPRRAAAAGRAALARLEGHRRGAAGGLRRPLARAGAGGRGRARGGRLPGLIAGRARGRSPASRKPFSGARPCRASCRRRRCRARARPLRSAGRSRRLRAGRASLIGSGTGTDALGRRFRVEFAIVDLGREKVVARYLGPEDAVAFNLGLIRRSLRSLQATPLLVVPPLRSLADASLEWAAFPNGEGGVVLPGAWPREPAQDAACAALPASGGGPAGPASQRLHDRAARAAPGAGRRAPRRGAARLRRDARGRAQRVRLFLRAPGSGRGRARRRRGAGRREAAARDGSAASRSSWWSRSSTRAGSKRSPSGAVARYAVAP